MEPQPSTSGIILRPQPSNRGITLSPPLTPSQTPPRNAKRPHPTPEIIYNRRTSKKEQDNDPSCTCCSRRSCWCSTTTYSCRSPSNSSQSKQRRQQKTHEPVTRCELGLHRQQLHRPRTREGVCIDRQPPQSIHLCGQGT